MAGIIIDSDKEGAVKAIVTGTTTYGVTTAFGIYILSPIMTASLLGGPLGVIVTAYISMKVAGYVDSFLNDQYDRLFGQEDTIEHNPDTNEITLRTSNPTASSVDIEEEIRHLNEFFKLLNSSDEINRDDIGKVKFEYETSDGIITYEIEKGDTVWDLCQKYDTTYDELIELNPWLSERFSDDKEFCLIRPGETLKIPCKGSGILDVKPTYDGGFKIAGQMKHVVDPMFLDLNKDGVLGTTSVSDGIYFDHEGGWFCGKFCMGG